mmetsp:Transcript_14925/g.37903  ORF Transcript_14925/g.37903 Transcript_14925/m.37903 type:complete len:265 (+) Transcript_14925:547-1341(+)
MHQYPCTYEPLPVVRACSVYWRCLQMATTGFASAGWCGGSLAFSSTVASAPTRGAVAYRYPAASSMLAIDMRRDSEPDTRVARCGRVYCTLAAPWSTAIASACANAISGMPISTPSSSSTPSSISSAAIDAILDTLITPASPARPYAVPAARAILARGAALRMGPPQPPLAGCGESSDSTCLSTVGTASQRSGADVESTKAASTQSSPVCCLTCAKQSSCAGASGAEGAARKSYAAAQWAPCTRYVSRSASGPARAAETSITTC